MINRRLPANNKVNLNASYNTINPFSTTDMNEQTTSTWCSISIDENSPSDLWLGKGQLEKKLW